MKEPERDRTVPDLFWRALAAMSLCLVFVTAILPALREIHTDFSNYYIPARLLVRGEPVTRLYEFSWFQRQMGYAGIENQSGAFNRFPPPAGLVLLPLGALEPLTAKRVWVAVQLLALAGFVLCLRSLAGLRIEAGIVLAALSGLALRNNLIFGQLYVLLGLALAAAFLLLRSGRRWGAGALLGAATAVKLYPAPFLVHFLLRREWRAALGFLAGAAAGFGLAAAAFGWDATAYFFSGVLPRSLAGGTDHPFHPGLQSAASLLRGLLVREPTLNPAPLVHAPFLFTLVRDLFTLGLFALVAARLRASLEPRALSLLALVLLCVSPVLLSYHVFLAVLPVALWVPFLFREGRHGKALAAIALLALAGSPLVYSWPAAHLRLVALLALLFLLMRDLPTPPREMTFRLSAAVFLLALAHAAASVRSGPSDGAVPVAFDAARSESPSAAAGRLVYARLEENRYGLGGEPAGAIPAEGDLFAPRWAAGGRTLFFEVLARGRSRVAEAAKDTFRYWSPENVDCTRPSPSAAGDRVVAVCEGRVFLFERPGIFREIPLGAGEPVDVALSPDGRRIAFTLWRGGRWRLFESDEEGDSLRVLGSSRGMDRWPSYAPDGKTIAFSRRENGGWRLWLVDVASGREWPVSRSDGNDTEPAWSGDARGLYFASDRGRGIFMPAIYYLELGNSL